MFPFREKRERLSGADRERSCRPPGLVGGTIVGDRGRAIWRERFGRGRTALSCYFTAE